MAVEPKTRTFFCSFRGWFVSMEETAEVRKRRAEAAPDAPWLHVNPYFTALQSGPGTLLPLPDCVVPVLLNCAPEEATCEKAWRRLFDDQESCLYACDIIGHPLIDDLPALALARFSSEDSFLLMRAYSFTPTAVDDAKRLQVRERDGSGVGLWGRHRFY